MCQEYLRKLSQSFNPRSLGALATPAQLIVIGCGEPDLINEYAARSECAFPIFSDRSRTLYEAFGMVSTAALGPKPQYQSDVSFTEIFVKSFKQAASAGVGAFRSGNYSQVGGEFLFQNGTIVWCHRMRSTRDHTEIDNLCLLLGHPR